MASASEMAGPFRLMFAVGGALTLVHLALPANGSSNDALLVAAAAACFGLAALISRMGRRLPASSYQPFNTAAAALTALIVYASGDSASAYTTFFFWIAISAFYFFDEAEAAEHWLVEEPPQRSAAPLVRRARGSFVVRGRLAGRRVGAVWCKGRVSGDPIVVTMVEQLVLSHRLDLTDPWNFLFLMSSAVEQGTIDAEGDVPGIDLVEPATV